MKVGPTVSSSQWTMPPVHKQIKYIIKYSLWNDISEDNMSVSTTNSIYMITNIKEENCNNCLNYLYVHFLEMKFFIITSYDNFTTVYVHWKFYVE